MKSESLFEWQADVQVARADHFAATISHPLACETVTERLRLGMLCLLLSAVALLGGCAETKDGKQNQEALTQDGQQINDSKNKLPNLDETQYATTTNSPLPHVAHAARTKQLINVYPGGSEEAEFYRQEKICRQTCGLSKTDWFLKNYHSPRYYNLPANFNPRNYEAPDTTRKFTQRSIAELLNTEGTNHLDGVLVFELQKSDISSKYNLRFIETVKNDVGITPKLSVDLTYSLLDAMVDEGVIKIRHLNSGERYIEILNTNVGKQDIITQNEKNYLLFTVPLFELGRVDADQVFYLKSLYPPAKQTVNTYYLRSLKPKNTLAKKILKVEGNHPDLARRGMFSAYSETMELDAKSYGMKLIQIGD